ncbi:MAG: redoxin domain-containing protein [Flavobacteriales bacterium]|nr:redoxin domain-containing protein [Flavobacteriales bacterium]
MRSRFHPLTTIGLLLALLTPAAFAIHQPQAGVFLLFLAYGFALLEFQKYTSNFQFVMILVCGTAMGISLDLLYGHWPWLTVGLSLAASATIVRQVFMPWFTYIDKLWLDTSKAAGAFFCYGMAIHDTPFIWDLWLLPVLPLLFALGLTFSYVQDARNMKKRTRSGYRVRIGGPAPDFELRDQAGDPVKLSDYKGKHPVLLIFVRGDWCPGCHMMLRTYERNRAKFMEKGIHVLGIGPDDISVNKDMVERIGVHYRMLSDDKQEVSSQYGVVYSNPLLELSVDYTEGIPLPASFLVDINGIVRYASRPDRVGEFLDPELIFNVLNDIPAVGEVAWN